MKLSTQKIINILFPIVPLSLLFIITAFAKEPIPKKEIRKDYYINGPANCREKPNGKILKSLPDAVTVKFLQSNRNWFKIDYNGTKCWTFKSNITIVDNSEEVGLTDKDLEVLENAKTENAQFKDLKLPDGTNTSEWLLKNDPCSLVKTPSGGIELQTKAKIACDAKNSK